MGGRVYIPGLGRFLSVDPVQGGTPNNYVYPVDPVNDFDLDGSFGWKKIIGGIAVAAAVGTVIPGPWGVAAGAVSAAAYASVGNKKAATEMAVQAAAAMVGGGLAAKAAQSVKVAQSANIALKAKKASSAANLAEKLTMSEVKANPRIGTQIMKDAIKDPKYKPILGWRKMQFTHRPLTDRGQKVTVHYFYNKYTRSVRQLKVKR